MPSGLGRGLDAQTGGALRSGSRSAMHFFHFDESFFSRSLDRLGRVRDFLGEIRCRQRTLFEQPQYLDRWSSSVAQQQLSRGVTSGVGQRIHLRRAHFTRERCHHTQHFADGSAVDSWRSTAPRPIRCSSSTGSSSSSRSASLDRPAGPRSCVSHDHAGQLPRAEWHQQPAARLYAVAQSFGSQISERLIERDRKCDVRVHSTVSRRSASMPDRSPGTRRCSLSYSLRTSRPWAGLDPPPEWRTGSTPQRELYAPVPTTANSAAP